MKHQYIDIKIYVKPMKNKEKIYISGGQIIYETPEKPIKGKVNKALIKTLSKKLGIPSTNIEIAAGLKARNKIIRIHGAGINKEYVLKKISD